MALLKEVETAIARSRDGQHYSSPELVGLLTRAAGELREAERKNDDLRLIAGEQNDLAIKANLNAIHDSMMRRQSEADAERYRWLRDYRTFNLAPGEPFICRQSNGNFTRWTGEQADAAIDAAIAASPVAGVRQG